MYPTLHDIARETNTSVSTVSRVLSGGAMANRISKETRQRVLEAAQRLGYRPNLLARSLRTRKTHTIALIVSDIANPFYGQIGSNIERALARHGYSLMLCNSSEDPDREAAYLQLVTQKAIDGLILVPLLRSKKTLAQLVPDQMPLVILDRPIPGVTASVATDQDQAANILCDTLLQAGVARIHLVTGPQFVATHRRRSEILTARFEVVARHEGPALKETGRHAFRKLIPGAVVAMPPDAVVCTNNSLAQGVLDSMALLNMPKPPIVGVFDEIPMMDVLPLPIVCAIQDVTALAESCVTQLLRLLDGQQAVEPITLPAKILTNRPFDAVRFGAQVVKPEVEA